MSLVNVFIICLYIHLLFGGLTRLSINDDNFLINDEVTYSSTTSNKNVQGLLFNSRMIQGVFDDANSSTISLWQYPDTHKWDPLRNTMEFVSNMSIWYKHNLLAFTVGLQGGMPILHHEGDQTWIVSAYDFKTGQLNMPFFNRLSLILSEADKLGMIPIIQLFYWGQMQRFNKNNTIILNSINNALDWLITQKYNNILIDVANECTSNDYHGTILQCNTGNMTSTIKYMKQYISSKDINNDTTIYIGSSLFPAVTPTAQLMAVSDIILLHGNAESYQTITFMIDTIRNSDQYKSNPIPIVFNEDNDYNFNSTSNNMNSAIQGHASWGFYVQGANDYIHGYQSPPVNWMINDNTEAAFFKAVETYTHS